MAQSCWQVCVCFILLTGGDSLLAFKFLLLPKVFLSELRYLEYSLPVSGLLALFIIVPFLFFPQNKASCEQDGCRCLVVGQKAGELWEPRMNAEVPAPQLGSEKSWDIGAQLTGFLRLPAVESANTLHLVVSEASTFLHFLFWNWHPEVDGCWSMHLGYTGVPWSIPW